MKEIVISRDQNVAVANFGQGKFVVANIEPESLKVHFRDVNLPGKDPKILANSESRYRSLYSYDFTPYQHVFMIMGKHENLSLRETLWEYLTNTFLFELFYENSLQNQDQLLTLRAEALVVQFIHSLDAEIRDDVADLNVKLQMRHF